MGLGFTPALDYIVVEEQLREESEHVTIPLDIRRQRSAKDGKLWGKVVAVGPGRPSEYTGETIMYPHANGSPSPSPCKVGGCVRYTVGAGFQDGEYRVIPPRDVLAVR